MKRIEISNLVSLEDSYDTVGDQEIGDGVRIESLRFDERGTKLYELLRIQNEEHYNRLIFRQQLEPFRPYSHRFFILVEDVTALYDPRIRDAEQLLALAIVLARMVKPLAIPLHPTSVRCLYDENGNVTCSAWAYCGFYSEAYVGSRKEIPKLNQAEAEEIQAYWRAFRFLYNNRPQHLRIYRALYMFNEAGHIRPLNVRHIILHTALESMICTSRNFKRKQVVQRLMQLTSLTEYQAEAIYQLCNDFKHSAAPNFLNSPDTENLTREDQEREETTLWLEAALCELFRKILADTTLLDDLADPQKLVKKYPVRNEKGKLDSAFAILLHTDR